MRDIVNTLRALASGLVPAVEEKAMRDAANEIERLELENINLTAERDEARRSCCEFAAMVDSADTVLMYVDSNRFHEIAMRYMKSRGWDCFKEDKPCQ